MTESTIGFATVMKRLIFALSLVAATAVAQTNPFLTPSPLPFQAPPFDKIKDADYQPALEEGMRRELAEMEQIANSFLLFDIRQNERAVRRHEAVEARHCLFEQCVFRNKAQ